MWVWTLYKPDHSIKEEKLGYKNAKQKQISKRCRCRNGQILFTGLDTRLTRNANLCQAVYSICGQKLLGVLRAKS